MDKLLKHLNRRWSGLRAHAGGGIALALLAFGLLGSQTATAGIATTKHNLGSSGVTGNNKFDGTGEICVFCHTPHGANITAVVPLWNRATTTAATYQTYNSLGTSSLDGATAPVGSVSLACLSCHDGTQAMNVMVNAPGSGNVALTGAWTGAGQTAGKITGELTKLDTNLQNDHPIGIQYAGGPKNNGAVPAVKSTYDNTLFKDVDFKATQSDSLNGNSVWWVDTSVGTAGSREKTDMQLYTRTVAATVNRDGTAGAALTGAQPFVECASCHDPHSNEATFLRISNASSAVCLACHTK